MMHTVRLLLSGRSILQSGEPIVRFTGESLALLMSIREGHRSFDDIMTIADGLLADCERLKATSSLPEVCDPTRATALLRELTESAGDIRFDPGREVELKGFAGTHEVHPVRLAY